MQPNVWMTTLSQMTSNQRFPFLSKRPINHFGEPDYNSPPIESPKYGCYINCGTYVKYSPSNDETIVQYGCILSVTLCHSKMDINQYEKIDNFMRTIQDDTIEVRQIRNRYIEVNELIQTTYQVRLSVSHLHGIIFVFRKRDIIDGNYPCKGMENAFVIEYKYVNNRFCMIPPIECLPFPCLYPGFPICKFFSRRVFDSIYNLKRSLTSLLCKNQKIWELISYRDLHQYNFQSRHGIMCVMNARKMELLCMVHFVSAAVIFK